jgi:hypothetical protein
MILNIGLAVETRKKFVMVIPSQIFIRAKNILEYGQGISM